MSLSSAYPFLAYKKALKEISRREKYENSEYKFPTDTISTLSTKLASRQIKLFESIKPISRFYTYSPDSPFCSEREFLLYRKYLDRICYYIYTYEDKGIQWSLDVVS